MLLNYEQHVTAALNFRFTTRLYPSNLVLKQEEVVPLRDIAWLRACHCLAVRKGVVEGGEGCGRKGNVVNALAWVSNVCQ